MLDPQSDHHRSTPSPPSSISALAVVAMVLSCIPCISAMGAVIGMIAWRRIRESQGRLTGRRLCLWAVIVGLAMTLLTFWSAQRFAQWQQREQERDMALVLDQFFHAASGGDAESAIDQWAPNLTSLDAAEVSAFADMLQSRFGTFESVRIGSSQPVSGPSLFELRVECWIIARFDSVDHNGSARFALKPTPDRFTLQPELLELTFTVKDGDAMQLPPAAEPDAEAAP